MAWHDDERLKRSLFGPDDLRGSGRTVSSQARLVRCQASAAAEGVRARAGFNFLVQKPACALFSLRHYNNAHCRPVADVLVTGLKPGWLTHDHYRARERAAGQKTDHIVRAARFPHFSEQRSPDCPL